MTLVYHHRENAAVAGFAVKTQQNSVATGADPRWPNSRLRMTLRRFGRLGIGLIAVLFMMAFAAAKAAEEKRSDAAPGRIADIIGTLVKIVQHGELRDTKYMEELLHVSFDIKGGWVNYGDEHYLAGIDFLPSAQPFADYLELTNYTIYSAGKQLPGARDHVSSITFMAFNSTVCIPRQTVNSSLLRLFGAPSVRVYSYFFSVAERQSNFRIVVSGTYDEGCLDVIEIQQLS